MNSYFKGKILDMKTMIDEETHIFDNLKVDSSHLDRIRT